MLALTVFKKKYQIGPCYVFFSHPLMTLKVVAGIHWEALKLWMKKIPLVPRPDPPKNSITFLD